MIVYEAETVTNTSNYVKILVIHEILQRHHVKAIQHVYGSKSNENMLKWDTTSTWVTNPIHSPQLIL